MSEKYPRYNPDPDDSVSEFYPGVRPSGPNYRRPDYRVNYPDDDPRPRQRPYPPSPEGHKPRRRGWKALVGAVALGVIPGTFFGILDGAARAMPPAMSGEVSVEHTDAKVYEIAGIQELYVLRARMGITTGVKFEGHPFGVDAKALGVINFNLEKTIHANNVMRDVRKGFKLDEAMKYELHPDRKAVSDGGNPEEPAIEMDLNLGDMITVVSDVPEIRDDDYVRTNDGMIGYFSEVFGKFFETETVKRVLGDASKEADISQKIDNLLSGTLRAHINEQAAKACMDEDKNDASKSLFKTSVIDSAKKIVLDDVNKRVEGSKYTLDDVKVNVTDPGNNPTVTNTDTDSDKKRQALNTVTEKPTEIKVGPVTVPIQFNLGNVDDPNNVPTCTYAPDMKRVER